MSDLKTLEAEARAIIDAVADSPDGRYQVRKDFYDVYGFGKDDDSDGYGRAELDFLKWEMVRGVLMPKEQGGSDWWRKTQAALSYNSVLAGLIAKERLENPQVPLTVQRWLDYIADPGAELWYRAHNTSIITGYLDATLAAHEEPRAELVLINEVLYRLLFAQAMVEGKVVGIIGEIAADPRLPAVEIITSLDALYPEHYPLTDREVEFVRHKARGPMADVADFLDLDVILPNIEALYTYAADLNGVPELNDLIRCGRPIYPFQPGGPVPKQPKKVVVLGGGMSAIAAVHELTNYPGWQDDYDITMYQMGWRMGGKAATGRGPNNRIEERGLHIFQGWYDNAFRLVQSVYAERRARGLAPNSPFLGWEQAFLRNDGTVLTEFLPEEGGWLPWPIIFPRTSELPGDGPPPTIWEQIRKVLGLMVETLFGSPYAHHFLPLVNELMAELFPMPDKPKREPKNLFDRVAGAVQGVVEGIEDSFMGPDAGELHDQAQHLITRLGPQPEDSVDHYNGRAMTREAEDALTDLLDGIAELLRAAAELLSDVDNGLRRMIIVVELALAVFKGLLADCWQWSTLSFNFDAINDQDFRAWLTSHGAGKNVTESVVVRFFYTGTFANQYPGDGQGGQMAAGVALQGVFGAAGYKGSFVWQTRAGTGDTLIMPMYQVLVDRGVKVKWFRQVTKVHWNDGDEIQQIDVARQVDLREEGVYEPGIEVPYEDGRDGKSVYSWPLEPNYEYIVPEQAAALKKGKVNLESPWADWQPVGHETLQLGTDFDQIILAIPIGTCETICADFRNSPAWAAMFDNVKSTMTLAAQLYLTPTLEDLGYVPSEWGMNDVDCALNLVTYANPQYSWVDTSQVLAAETWPADNRPQTIGLWCGALVEPPVIPPPSDHGFPGRMQADVAALTRQWVQDNMAFFLPKGTSLGSPAGLDLKYLADCENRLDATQLERWATQYFVANVAPDLRFTLSVPGSNQHRLKTDETGFNNLFITGDWIDFGLNIGYMEGTIIAGLQAGQAVRTRLLDSPVHQPIYVSLHQRATHTV